MLTSHLNDRVTPICEPVLCSDTAFFENQIMGTQTLTPVNVDRNCTSSTLLHGEPYYSFNQPLSRLFGIQQHCTPRGFSLPSHSFFFDMDYIIRLHRATYESVNDIFLSNFISPRRATVGTVNTDPMFPTNSASSVNTPTHPTICSPSIQSMYSSNNVNTGSASLPGVRSWPHVRPTQRTTRLFSSNQRPSNSIARHDRRTTSSSILQTILSFLGLSNIISTLPRPPSFEFESRRNADVLRPTECHEMQGVPRHLIQMLPAETFVYSANESRFVGVCPVCHSDYVNYDRRKRLPCLHHFHAECIDKWLTTRRSCPVCRLCVMATLQQTDALLNNERRGDYLIDETRDTDVPRAPDPISSDLTNTLSENSLLTTRQTSCIEVLSSSSSSSAPSITNDMSKVSLHDKEKMKTRTREQQEIPLINFQKTMRFGPPVAVDVISLDSSVLLVKDNSPSKQAIDSNLFQQDWNTQEIHGYAGKTFNTTFNGSCSSASGSVASSSVASGSGASSSGVSSSVAGGSGASGSGASGSGASSSGASSSGASSSGASSSVASSSVASGSVASGSVASGSVASGSVASGSVASGSVASGSVASGSGASSSVANGKSASTTRRSTRVRFRVLEDKIDTKIIQEEEIDDCPNTFQRLKETQVEKAGSTVLSEDVYTKTPRSFYTRPTCFILNPSSRFSLILNDGLTTDSCHTSNY